MKYASPTHKSRNLITDNKKLIVIFYFFQTLYKQNLGKHNPMPTGKCCIHFSTVLLNVSVHRWLCQCLSTNESINISCDLNFLEIARKCFFSTNAINIGTVIFVINIILTILFTLLTAISNPRKYYQKSSKRVNR